MTVSTALEIPVWSVLTLLSPARVIVTCSLPFGFAPASMTTGTLKSAPLLSVVILRSVKPTSACAPLSTVIVTVLSAGASVREL